MKKSLLAFMLLTAGTVFAAQFSVGVRIGPPPAPRVVRVRPRAPGPGYSYVDGYWYANGNRYAWHDGYWTRPPYEGANWAAPRYEGGQYYAGYWNGANGQVQHDHQWDRDRRNRDYNRKGDDHDNGRH